MAKQNRQFTQVDKKALGTAGETTAAQRLTELGFEILARNVRMQRGEIDLVACRNGVIWIVECKSRSRADVGPPYRAVDRRKRRALYAAAREYLASVQWTGDWGFLIASVVFTPGSPVPSVDLLRLSIGFSPSDGWRGGN